VKTGDKWPRMVENMAQWSETYANTISAASVASYSRVAMPVAACRTAAVPLGKTAVVVVVAAPIHKVDSAAIVADIRNQAEMAPARVTVDRSYSVAGIAVRTVADSVVAAAADCTYWEEIVASDREESLVYTGTLGHLRRHLHRRLPQWQDDWIVTAAAPDCLLSLKHSSSYQRNTVPEQSAVAEKSIGTIGCEISFLRVNQTVDAW
jgi:hypothetical protein